MTDSKVGVFYFISLHFHNNPTRSDSIPIYRWGNFLKVTQPEASRVGLGGGLVLNRSQFGFGRRPTGT